MMKMTMILLSTTLLLGCSTGMVTRKWHIPDEREPPFLQSLTRSYRSVCSNDTPAPEPVDPSIMLTELCRYLGMEFPHGANLRFDTNAMVVTIYNTPENCIRFRNMVTQPGGEVKLE